MGEDLDKYEITPADLGQDAENDPGVVEEAIASGGEKKQPISPCFSKIPFKSRQAFRKIYDTFEGADKDMPFEEFCIELYFMQSKLMMQRDLEKVIEQKHQGNRQMAANLHNMKKNMN